MIEFLIGIVVGLFIGIAIHLLLRDQQKIIAISDRVDRLEELKEGVLVNEKGWYDRNNHFKHFDDYFRNPIPRGDFVLTVYRVINGSTMYTELPIAQTVTRTDGSFVLYLPEGEYEFNFFKDGVIDTRVIRKVG